MTDNSGSRSRVVLDCIYYAVAIFFFLYLFTYFWTSEGGPTLLAMTLVPVTYVLFILSSLRANDLYPRLPPIANYAIAAVYIGCALAVSVYMNMEYYELGTSRAGAWDPSDLFMGGLMALLVLEYSRKRHMPLFVLNIVLIFYAVYGWLVPGMFHHAGLSWNRVVTAMSVENTTGVFSNLPQIALTTIGSFLLVLSVLTGYGCIEFAAARDQAGCLPLAARAAAVGRRRLDVRRDGERQRRGERDHHRLGHHSGHDRRRHAAGHRGRDRVGLLARRPVDAAGHGRVGLPHGRVPRAQLLRRRRARLRAGPDLLRHRRGVGVSPGGAPSHAARHRLVRSA